MDTKKQNELVLVFKEELMYGFTGLLPHVYPNLLWLHGVSNWEDDILWLKHCCKHSFFQPRGVVEEDPRYKQIIPYIIVKNKDRVFTYQRDGAESRLTKKISIGIGGHINIDDYNFLKSPEGAVKNAAYREFMEELDLGDISNHNMQIILRYLDAPVAVLFAGRSEDIVNQVHLGAVFIVHVPDEVAAEITLKEEGKQLDWVTVKDLSSCSDLEEWSKLVALQCL